MANLSLRIPGASFANNIGENIPAVVADDAELFHLFGGTEAKSVRNFVGAKAASSVVGTPTYPLANAARLSNANGYEAAAVAAGGAFTFAGVVTRPVGGATQGIMGTWIQGTAAIGLVSYAGTSLRLGVDGATSVSLTVPASGVQFVAGVFDGTTAKIFNGVSAVLSSANAAYTGGASTCKFRIGGSLIVGGDTFDAHCAAYWKRALSNTDVQAVYEYFQREMARRGITGV